MPPAGRPKNTLKLSDNVGITNAVKTDSLKLKISKDIAKGLSGDKPFIANVGNMPKVLNHKIAVGEKHSDKHHDKCHDNKCYDKCFKTCPWWYCWNYPTWCPLYRYGCGYWYEVPVVVIREGVDLQLLAVRLVDSGDPEAQLGPVFRVWIRSNSPVAINHPFNVLVLAGRAAQATADLPQAGVRIENILPGQVLPVDIRLPVTANQPGLPMLHVLVDSHREILEVYENNNGAVLNRAEILPVETTPVAAPTTLTAEPVVAAPVAAEAPTVTEAPAATEAKAVTEAPEAEVPLILQGVNQK